MALDNIDGIPINWNQESDKKLLGSLFPNTPVAFNEISQSRFPTNMQKISNQVARDGAFKEDSIFNSPVPEVLTEDSFKNPIFKSIENDWELLLKNIRNNGMGNKFLLNYAEYDTTNPTDNSSESTKTNIQLPIEEVHKEYIADSNFFVDKYSNFSCAINQLVNYIDTNSYRGISFQNKVIEYDITFFYKYDKLNEIFLPVDNTSFENEVRTFSKYAGIIFKSNNHNDIFAILDYLRGAGFAEKNVKTYIISKCYDFLKANRNDIEQLNLLYKQMPLFVLQSMKNEDLWDDLLALIQYDNAHLFKDSSNAIIRCICGFSDTKYLFDKFSSNPQLLIHIYHSLDGSFVEMNEDQSVKQVQSSKMSFVSILTALCLLHLDATNKKNVTFTIGEDADGNEHRPGVNLTEGGESKEGKIYLSQSDELAPLDNPENYYHPLDMVHLVLNDKDHKLKKSIPVPAIYVRAIARDIRIGEITFALRLVGDIIMLMFAVITLYGSVAAPAIFLRLLSYADIFLGGTDLGVQSSKKYLQQSALGRQFYELWDKIYAYGGFATAAPTLVSTFYKIGLAAIKSLPFNSLESLAIIDEMIRATVERNTFLSKFTLEIVLEAEQAAIITGNRFNIAPIARLMEVDVLFIKATHIEAATEEFFAIYKGEIIAKGTAKEIREILKKAMSAAGRSKIIAALDKLFDTVYVGDDVLKHSYIGDFAGVNNPKKSLEPGKMLGGGHGEANFVKLNQLKRSYKIEYVYENGVRIGSISQIADKFKKTTSNKIITGQSWFPVNWDTRKIYLAGKFVINNKFKEFINIKDGLPVFDTFEGVRVGVMKTNGKPKTIFPDNAKQSLSNTNNFEFNPFKKQAYETRNN